MTANDSRPESTAFFCHNPLEADEFVWLTTDIDRAEVFFIPRPSPYKVDKNVYVVSATHELHTLFANLSNADFKAIAFYNLKEFSYRNCGVPSVTMVAALKAE